MYLLILPRRAIVSLLRKKMGYIMIEMYKVAIVCDTPLDSGGYETWNGKSGVCLGWGAVYGLELGKVRELAGTLGYGWSVIYPSIHVRLRHQSG